MEQKGDWYHLGPQTVTYCNLVSFAALSVCIWIVRYLSVLSGFILSEICENVDLLAHLLKACTR